MNNCVSYDQSFGLLPFDHPLCPTEGIWGNSFWKKRGPRSLKALEPNSGWVETVCPCYVFTTNVFFFPDSKLSFLGKTWKQTSTICAIHEIILQAHLIKVHISRHILKKKMGANLSFAQGQTSEKSQNIRDPITKLSD